jgi:hypothetical protein
LDFPPNLSYIFSLILITLSLSFKTRNKGEDKEEEEEGEGRRVRGGQGGLGRRGGGEEEGEGKRRKGGQGGRGGGGREEGRREPLAEQILSSSCSNTLKCYLCHLLFFFLNQPY